MAATIEIRSFHGSVADAGTDVAAGTLRFKVADNSTVDTNNPIPIPGAGDGYSFLKHCKFYAAAAPDNLIDNLEFYTDGANGLGTGVTIDALTGTAYDDPIAKGTAQMTGGTDIFTYVQSAALSVSGTMTTTGAFGDYVRMQMIVSSTASQGTISPGETLTFSYDES